MSGDLHQLRRELQLHVNDGISPMRRESTGKLSLSEKDEPLRLFHISPSSSPQDVRNKEKLHVRFDTVETITEEKAANGGRNGIGEYIDDNDGEEDQDIHDQILQLHNNLLSLKSEETKRESKEPQQSPRQWKRSSIGSNPTSPRIQLLHMLFQALGQSEKSDSSATPNKTPTTAPHTKQQLIADDSSPFKQAPSPNHTPRSRQKKSSFIIAAHSSNRDERDHNDSSKSRHVAFENRPRQERVDETDQAMSFIPSPWRHQSARVKNQRGTDISGREDGMERTVRTGTIELRPSSEESKTISTGTAPMVIVLQEKRQKPRPQSRKKYPTKNKSPRRQRSPAADYNRKAIQEIMSLKKEAVTAGPKRRREVPLNKPRPVRRNEATALRNISVYEQLLNEEERKRKSRNRSRANSRSASRNDIRSPSMKKEVEETSGMISASKRNERSSLKDPKLSPPPVIVPLSLGSADNNIVRPALSNQFFEFENLNPSPRSGRMAVSTRGAFKKVVPSEPKTAKTKSRRTAISTNKVLRPRSGSQPLPTTFHHSGNAPTADMIISSSQSQSSHSLRTNKQRSRSVVEVGTNGDNQNAVLVNKLLDHFRKETEFL